MTAQVLDTLLREGVPAAEPHLSAGGWTVRRAWPRKLDDPAAGLVAEVESRNGRLRRGAQLSTAGVHVLDEDKRLPSLQARIRIGDEVIGHRPGKRAVLRTRQGTFLKLARPQATVKALSVMGEIESLFAGVRCAPLLPQAHAGWAGHGMLELLPAAGRPLDLTIAGDPRGEAAAVAALLLSMPRVGAERGTLGRHDLADEAAVLQRWSAAALTLAPLSSAQEHQLHHGAPRVIQRLREAQSAVTAAPGQGTARILAHRDLHEGQILRDGQDTTVLDWDTAAWAHPATDIANLLTHIARLAQLGQLPQQAAATFRREVLRLLHEGGHPALASSQARRTLALLSHATRLRLVAVHAFRRPTSR